MLKIEHLLHVSNNGLCLCGECAVCVTIFSTGGKLSNSTKLHTLTLAACSCVLLTLIIPLFLDLCTILFPRELSGFNANIITANNLVRTLYIV